jgi:ECF sigma factor
VITTVSNSRRLRKGSDCYSIPSRRSNPTAHWLSDITRILDQVHNGDPKAAAVLLPLVYDELRQIAADKMANEMAGHTLQPTALVHEACLRLAGADGAAQFHPRTSPL